MKNAYWAKSKTEASDFSMPFIWIDDVPLLSEIEILKQKGRGNCLLVANNNQTLLRQLKEFGLEFKAE